MVGRKGVKTEMCNQITKRCKIDKESINNIKKIDLNANQREKKTVKASSCINDVCTEILVAS